MTSVVYCLRVCIEHPFPPTGHFNMNNARTQRQTDRQYLSLFLSSSLILVLFDTSRTMLEYPVKDTRRSEFEFFSGITRALRASRFRDIREFAITVCNSILFLHATNLTMD